MELFHSATSSDLPDVPDLRFVGLGRRAGVAADAHYQVRRDRAERSLSPKHGGAIRV
jgi:hypothetical protein